MYNNKQNSTIVFTNISSLYIHSQIYIYYVPSISIIDRYGMDARRILTIWRVTGTVLAAAPVLAIRQCCCTNPFIYQPLTRSLVNLFIFLCLHYATAQLAQRGRSTSTPYSLLAIDRESMNARKISLYPWQIDDKVFQLFTSAQYRQYKLCINCSASYFISKLIFVIQILFCSKSQLKKLCSLQISLNVWNYQPIFNVSESQFPCPKG